MYVLVLKTTAKQAFETDFKLKFRKYLVYVETHFQYPLFPKGCS